MKHEECQSVSISLWTVSCDWMSSVCWGYELITVQAIRCDSEGMVELDRGLKAQN